MCDFLADRKSSILGFWAAPGGRETFQKRWGAKPPTFLEGSRPPGAAQIPKIDDLRSVKKSYIKNPGVPPWGAAAPANAPPYSWGWGGGTPQE